MAKLRAGTFVHEISAGQVRVGSTPEHTVVFSSVTEDERRWLNSLRSGGPRSKSGRPTSARQEQMLDLLSSSALLNPAPRPLSKLRIRIDGLDRVGVTLAHLLAQEGVRHLDLRDLRRVDADVEHLFPDDAKGMKRAESLSRALDGNRQLRLGRVTYPDLVVTTNDHVWDHAQAGLLLGHDINHVPIIVEDRAIRVGPFISPGVTACAVCVDMHVRDADPSWPKTYLALRGAEPIIPSNHMASAAAGLALVMIESAALGIRPAPEVSGQATARQQRLQQSPAGPLLINQVATSHSWRVTQHGVETSTWLPHPDCGCLSLPVGSQSEAS